MARSTILEHELSELRLLVERQTGSFLDCPNTSLANHLASYISAQQMESAAPLLERLRSSDQDPSLVPEFLEGLLDTTTGFFRHPGAMNAFARQVLPQLHARKTAEGGQVRIWSAGCSTGEEAYSIAMAVCGATPPSNSVNSTSNKEKDGKEKNSNSKDGQGKERSYPRNGGIAEAIGAANVQSANDWAVQIVGSDLLSSAIQIAERGLYPQSAVDGLPPAAIRACFSKIGAASRVKELEIRSPAAPSNVAAHVDSDASSLGVFASSDSASNSEATQPLVRPLQNSAGTHLLVKARLRSMVTFNTMNLVRPVYIGRFDCIFCMDVLPSLSRAQRSALIERLHLYLEPGGYLFLSQTEKLSAPSLNFRSETFDGYTFHRKPLAASAAYGR
ncbi:MAG TPA: CheR family methyltransferase [Candidatus Sulfotelmatobacter sp.]